MKEKPTEAPDIVYDICADVVERYPIGLIHVRRLLEEALAGHQVADDEEAIYLDTEP